MILVKTRVEVILRLPFAQFSCSDKSIFVRVKRTSGNLPMGQVYGYYGWVCHCAQCEVKGHPTRLNSFVNCSMPPESLGVKNGKDM